ncbi:tripartite tricarboxylate transporter substrate binding protein [Sagittula sp. MA-2]|jgi:tripartite-type tricarboxylate transporter receptor subunit TctC|uniref:tripartite tricarboxylate transporter substrate binding protein n=1 Tax=Sagittula sp. MA-2 TaxID=3048007 RepID=UPI0024C4525C|nr:tripartite tricarboxylate transporter substrate binding protein [Sagittula sp. MA-2]WHZ36612.1 tripartite tricarboxylate transporter substrate binding protein [Sagittula sp. MA-2]
MNFIKTAAAAAVTLAAVTGAAWAEYPERPIQLIVPWGAGGGTDAVGRLLGAEIQKELGVPVNVVNRTGGSGVVGHSAIANAEPDGYTIGIMTIEIDMMHWQGLTELTYEDFDILAIVNADPGGVMVSADSGFDSVEALLESIKSEPAGTYKASGTGQGGIWHVGLAGWLLSEGLAPDHVTFVPSQGAAPGLTDMVAGGVDIVPSSLAEGRSMIDANRVVALATMSAERQNAFPDVPTLAESTGSDWTVAVWRSVAAPDGLPDDVKTKLMDAIETAYNSEEYQTFMKDRGFGLRWARGDEATQIVADDDAAFGEVMKKAGLAAE